MARRSRGDGAITQRHDHPSCPPAVDGVRRQHRCQGRWMAQLDLGTVAGKRRRKTVYGRTRKEVALKLSEQQRAHLSGAVVVGSPTVEQWLTYWLVHIAPERIKDTSVEAYRQKIDRYIVPLIGNHRLEHLAVEHVRAMYQRLAGPCPEPDGRGRCIHNPAHGLSPTSVRMVHSILGRALKVAVRERKVAHNVCELIDAPSPSPAGRKPLSLTEARKVLAIADDARWWCALYLGIRQGEALGLRWSSVNLERGYLAIVEGGVLHWRQGATPAFGDPKSKSSLRVVPLPTVVLSRLKIAWAEHVNAGGGIDDLVWHDGSGQARKPRADRAAWARLLKKAGVPHAALHAARGTTASLLDEAGVSPRIQSEILGHGSVALTQNVYTRGNEESHRKAMAALEAHVDRPTG